MTFKKNIKRKFHIQDVLDPWASEPIYEILLKESADSMTDVIYTLRDNFVDIDSLQKMNIYFEAFELFKQFLDECKKRDLFYE